MSQSIWIFHIKFFCCEGFIQKNDIWQKEFDEDLGIIKNIFPIQFFESIWFKILALYLCPGLNFLSKRQFSQEILANLVVKINQLYVLLNLIECYATITSFDLWMNKGAHDVFALVVNFLGFNWQPKHIIIGLFETTKNFEHVLARNLIDSLDKFGSRKKNHCICERWGL
jgi:hypothetical protein